MIIAVDAAGGEYAPHEIVKGAIKAAQEYDVDIALVGSKAILHVLAGRYLKKLNLSIVEASQVISPHEAPLKAVRSKPDSSIVVGINLVRDGRASAFISAGNTGAVLCASFLSLGKIAGVERPALGSIINIAASPFNIFHAAERLSIFKDQVKKSSLPLFNVNQVGAHTNLIFDGGSCVFDSLGELVDEGEVLVRLADDTQVDA